MSKQILSLMSNCDFTLDYKTKQLQPKVELIFVLASPKYGVNKKTNKLTVEQEISELRFIASPNGVNEMIGQLKVALDELNHFAQMSESLNHIISQNTLSE
jgi:hypothetical protein